MGLHVAAASESSVLRTKLYYRRIPLKRKEEGDGGEEMGIHMLF